MVHTGDTFTVYILKNEVNGKRYVGCTRVPLKERFQSGQGYRHNKTLNADIKKCGWENFSHEVVGTFLDHNTASALEVEMMLKYNTLDPAHGYNKTMRSGAGLYGYVSKPHNGRNHGKKASQATREKMSKAHKGIKQNPEWVEARMSKVRGRKRSVSHTEKLLPTLTRNAEKAKRPCKAVNIKTGEVLCFDSIKEAKEATGCTNISNAIKNGFVRKGYRFEYAERV